MRTGLQDARSNSVALVMPCALVIGCTLLVPQAARAQLEARFGAIRDEIRK